ncbi:MAG: hypothetical protein ACRD25_11980, partial [Terracidiphilus sp.]
QGLQKLSRQLQDAEQAIGREKPAGPGAANGDESAALDRVERLRSWIQAMGQPQNGNPQRNRLGNNQSAQNAGPGSQSGSQPGSQSGSQPSPSGNRPGGFNPQLAPNGQQGSQAAGLSRFGADRGGTRGGLRRNGDVGGPVGEARYGRGADGTVWNNFNTGNNTYGRMRQQGVPTDASGNPADTERSFQQNMIGLSQLRQMLQGDPQMSKDVAELTRQMRNLDPHRFPGNPAEVERMHRELLNTVGRIELQLQRDGTSSDARTGKPSTVPDGYQDAVAEYYKRLSKNP